MGTAYTREEWEGEVFDNLEAMCAEHPRTPAARPPEPENAPRASEAELATCMQEMSGAGLADDDDAWCPRLA